MFGTDTGNKIPRALLDSHEAWDHHVGGIWAAVLMPEKLPADATVIEIAPGSAVKIASALAHMKFSGTLYIVDPAPDVIAALAQRYKTLLPKADIRFITATFAESIPQLPRNADLLVASHMVDDMILSRADQSAVADWAAAYTHRPSDLLARAWAQLSGDMARLSAIKANVGAEVRDNIMALQSGLFAFNQYPSSVLYDNGLSSLNDHAYDVFRKLSDVRGYEAHERDVLQARLDQQENFGNEHIGQHVLNAKYWMLCKRK